MSVFVSDLGAYLTNVESNIVLLPLPPPRYLIPRISPFQRCVPNSLSLIYSHVLGSLLICLALPLLGCRYVWNLRLLQLLERKGELTLFSNDSTWVCAGEAMEGQYAWNVYGRLFS